MFKRDLIITFPLPKHCHDVKLVQSRVTTKVSYLLAICLTAHGRPRKYYSGRRDDTMLYVISCGIMGVSA